VVLNSGHHKVNDIQLGLFREIAILKRMEMYEVRKSTRRIYTEAVDCE